MEDTLPCAATLRHADAGNRACDEQGMTVSTSAAVTHATRPAALPDLAYAATPALVDRDTHVGDHVSEPVRPRPAKAVEGTPARMEGLGA